MGSVTGQFHVVRSFSGYFRSTDEQAPCGGCIRSGFIEETMVEDVKREGAA
jgi:hypothetical protein